MLLKIPHFKRIGTSKSFQLVQHDVNEYYAEWRQSKNALDGVLIQKFESDSLLPNTKMQGVSNNDFVQVRNAIAAYTGRPLELGTFFESYFISARDCPTDRDFIGCYDIMDMTIREVIAETGINLEFYFNDWNKSEWAKPVAKILRTTPAVVLDMHFNVLHDLIHWNHYKPEYASIFMAGIGMEAT